MAGTIADKQPDLMHAVADRMAKELGADALVMFALNSDRTVAVAQYFTEDHAAYLTPHTVAHVISTVGVELLERDAVRRRGDVH